MKLEVVTPKGSALAAEVDEVTAPGARGEFGVLPGHTPFISALKPGVLVWRQKGGPRGVVAVGAGFAEVSGADKVVVLTQRALAAEQIDAAQAQKDLEEADRQLKDWKAPVESQAATAPSREELESRRAWAQACVDARKV
ncbi:MAG: ATP synthase F1 subunit epsilon [Polyangia bacterium]|jgi:F-type H+-transporting ATPase subunit epsilon